MKRSLKELIGYTIRTQDGKEGKVKDLLFDEKRWIIRYVEADFGNLFSSERILIPKAFLDKQHDLNKRLFETKLNQESLEKCPKPEDHQPVSRKFEEEIHEFYQLNPYWSYAYMQSAGSFYPPRPIDIPTKAPKEEEIDTILRSFNEVEGYHIHAIDGKLGHIEDIIIDDVDWQLIYVIIDTSNWLPWSKKVIIAVEWMERISYVDREVKLNLHTDTIKKAPEYNTDKGFDLKFEQSLYDYYSSGLVK